MKHQGTKPLETKRLILRRFTMNDVQESYNNWTSDIEMTKYTRWSFHKSIKETADILAFWTYSYIENNFYQWAIVLKDTNEIIGTISAFNIDDDVESVELGYCIGEKWWHHGYTSEAAAELIKFFFEEVNAKRIEAKHDVNNPNSGKVMKKIGMTYEGTLRKASKNVRGIVDVSIYSILKKEYERLYAVCPDSSDG